MKLKFRIYLEACQTGVIRVQCSMSQMCGCSFVLIILQQLSKWNIFACSAFLCCFAVQNHQVLDCVINVIGNLTRNETEFVAVTSGATIV